MPRTTPRLLGLLAAPAALACLLSGLTTPASASPAGSDPTVTSSQHGVPSSAPSPGARRSPHARILPRHLGGDAAVAALGDRLPAVAARNGLAAHKLTAILRHDRTAQLSTAGDLYFVEPSADATSTSGTAAADGVAPTYPLDQTFRLHSHPTSTKKIYLDFVGGTISGTAWNGTSSGKVPDGSFIGLDLDGAPSTFSSGEQGFVQEVWRQVAETYAPFDVDVTTQDPGTGGLTRTDSSDQTFGTKVFITSASAPRTDVCGSCLGYAWIGTFDMVDARGYYQPAWVFDYNSAFDPMIIAQAAAHETGHTLGLSHDGTSSSPYYGGTAGWGPVMGSARLRAVTQFSKGEYADADNQQDDLAVIRSNGLALRPDDHPSSAADARALGDHPSYAVNGVIESRTDTDVFSVDLSCSTDLSATVRGIGAQTTLDAGLTILDGSGREVAGSSPASSYTSGLPISTGMDATATVPAATGRYYLVVDGVGNGSPANGGWSDYGSLGQYRLTAAGCGTTTTPSTTPTTEPPTTTPTTPTTPTGITPRKGPRPPSAPRIRWAFSGHRWGKPTAVARWLWPADNGGARITMYRVTAERMDGHGHVLRTYHSRFLGGWRHRISLWLPRGHYRFQVRAWNNAGFSPLSARSRVVTSR